MSLFTAMEINTSGLTAQRRRFEVAQSNLVNSNTTHTQQGGPYRRQDIVFQTKTFGSAMQEANGSTEGVEVAGVVDDMTPFDVRYEPGHPDAVNGYVSYPNIKPLEETMNTVDAARGYEANIAAISIAKAMINRTLDLGK